MEAHMRKMLALVIATAVLAACLGLWFKSTDVATGSIAPASISTHDLHLRTDVKKLPATTIEDLY
jgi:hypothetical protein